MEEKNPLDIHTSILPKRPLQSNIRGRPTSCKVVNFTPQPKSIVSQLLNKAREEDCNDVKEKIHLSDVSREPCSIPNVNEEINLDLEKLPNLINTYEDIQGSFTFHLSNSEDCNEYNGLNDSSLLLRNGQSSYQMHSLDEKKTENESMSPEITCYVCSHRSSTHKAHRKHLGTHRNQPYKCNFPDCNYTCKLSSNLIKHKRIHTSEKPYLCDQCTFRCNFGNSLKVHKRTHTSERPYGCQYCNYRCNSSSNLKKHCLHRHREKT